MANTEVMADWVVPVVGLITNESLVIRISLFANNYHAAQVFAFASS